MEKSTAGLSLYHFDSCPYCVRVREAAARLGLELELRTTRETPSYGEEMYKATGQTMVPCLRIEEKGSVRWMHESLDIVDYLEERFS